MNDHAVKFIFLGVVVVAILFSRALYPFSSDAAPQNGSLAAQTGTVIGTPRFVFPQTSVSADGAPSPAPAPASASAPTSKPENAPSSPTLADTATLVMDLKTGAVVASANADRRWPTASLAKLMSATVVLDKIDLNTQITITDQMFAADPAEANLFVDGRYQAIDLLHAMLLPSSNVAAEAVATFYGRDAFIAEMNARAAAWGMADTHYDDPSGISAGDESTALDLAKLAAQVYARYPQILSISRTPQFPITNYTTGAVGTLHSINNFAGQADFIGGKTGHTEEADGNLLSIFRDGDHPILVIVLGSANRFGDTQTLYNWYKANQE